MLKLHHLLVSGHPVPELLIKSYYKGNLYLPCETTSGQQPVNPSVEEYDNVLMNAGEAIPLLHAYGQSKYTV